MYVSFAPLSPPQWPLSGSVVSCDCSTLTPLELKCKVVVEYISVAEVTPHQWKSTPSGIQVHDPRSRGPPPPQSLVVPPQSPATGDCTSLYTYTLPSPYFRTQPVQPASHPTMHPFQTSSAPCHDSSHAAVARPSKRLCHDGASIASANAAAIAGASRVVLTVDCSGAAAATGADADHCVGDGDAVDGDGDGDGCDYSSQRRARGQGGQRRGQGMQGSHASRTITPLSDDAVAASSSSSSVPFLFAPASDAGVRD